MSSFQVVCGFEEFKILNVHLWEEIDIENSKFSSVPKRFHDSLTLCLIEVPAFMIPKDILIYFGSAIENVISCQVLQRLNNPGKYVALLKMRTTEDAQCLVRDYHGQSLCSLEPTTCWLYEVVEASNCDDDGNENVDSTSSKSGSTKLGEQNVFSTALKSALHDGELNSDSRLIEQCPLCLEPLAEGGGIFTTFCGHSFHIACMCQLNAPQCPVCRFQHDSDDHALSECNSCGWHGHSRNDIQTTRVAAAGDENHSSDLWVCLLCGYMGCGRSHLYHIGAHYSRHLHAYAMNVDTRRVWDFAGDGYVHRLVLHKPDPGDDNLGAQLKITEVVRPDHSSGNERSRQAELSQAEEERLIDFKLERAASNYNHILTWQLLQHRELYAARVKMVQAFAEPMGASAGKRRNFQEEVIRTLAIESEKARKLTESARARLIAAQEELAVSNKLQGSLMTSEQEWQRRVSTASNRLSTMEQKRREGIPKLEKMVASLMQRIDALDAEEKEQQLEEARRGAAVAGSSSSGAAGTSCIGVNTAETALPGSDESDSPLPSLYCSVDRPSADAVRSQLLRRKISSDIDDLQVLHATYPFVPAADQVRPSPAMKEQKAIKLKEITEQWRDFVDFIYHMAFDCPFLEGDDKRRVVAQRHRNTITRDGRHSFKPNIFPYMTQGNHYVMWFPEKEQKRTDDQITETINASIKFLVGSDQYDFGWYVNPKMTVPEFFHVQVFWVQY